MRISVVMPSYNQGQFLDASIRSLIEQDYADKELIFCLTSAPVAQIWV